MHRLKEKMAQQKYLRSTILYDCRISNPHYLSVQIRQKLMRSITVIAFILLFTTGCHTSSKNHSKSLQLLPASLQGNFKDDYGSEYSINTNEWVQDTRMKYHLLLYNKEANYLIAKNDETNPSGGGLYTRIDIMYFENMDPWQWGFCLTAYKAATMQEAINTAAADRTNPRKGCSGFPFTRMKRK